MSSSDRRPRDQVFAVVREDVDAPPEARFTVKEVVRTQAEAEAEVARLTALNRTRGCHYTWQATRLFARGTSAGRAAAPPAS
jgi:hypothetical protein